MSLQGFRKNRILLFSYELTFAQRTYFLSKAYFDWAQEVGNVDGGESYIEECPP